MHLYLNGVSMVFFCIEDLEELYFIHFHTTYYNISKTISFLFLY